MQRTAETQTTTRQALNVRRGGRLIIQSGRRDLNPRPPEPHVGAANPFSRFPLGGGGSEDERRSGLTPSEGNSKRGDTVVKAQSTGGAQGEARQRTRGRPFSRVASSRAAAIVAVLSVQELSVTELAQVIGHPRERLSANLADLLRQRRIERVGRGRYRCAVAPHAAGRGDA